MRSGYLFLMNVMIGIYQIKCLVNNKCYIGQSVNLKQRLFQHKSNLKKKRHHNSHLQRAVNLYGLDNFSFKIIHLLSENEYSIEKLDELEKYYIKLFQSDKRPFGYNIESGGFAKGHISNETKHKLSIVHTGKKYGKRSEETRALMRKNHAHYWQGKHLNEETKEKIRQKNLGRIPVMKGKHFNEEHSKNISKAQMGSIWVHKDNESHFIKPEKLNDYLEQGFVLGRPHFKRKRK